MGLDQASVVSNLKKIEKSNGRLLFSWKNYSNQSISQLICLIPITDLIIGYKLLFNYLIT